MSFFSHSGVSSNRGLAYGLSFWLPFRHKPKQGTDIYGHGSKPMVPFWDRCTTHFRTYVSGDWDVHWGYELGFDKAIFILETRLCCLKASWKVCANFPEFNRLEFREGVPAKWGISGWETNELCLRPRYGLARVIVRPLLTLRTYIYTYNHLDGAKSQWVFGAARTSESFEGASPKRQAWLRLGSLFLGDGYRASTKTPIATRRQPASRRDRS